MEECGAEVEEEEGGIGRYMVRDDPGGMALSRLFRAVGEEGWEDGGVWWDWFLIPGFDFLN